MSGAWNSATMSTPVGCTALTTSTFCSDIAEPVSPFYWPSPKRASASVVKLAPT